MCRLAWVASRVLRRRFRPARHATLRQLDRPAMLQTGAMPLGRRVADRRYIPSQVSSFPSQVSTQVSTGVHLIAAMPARCSKGELARRLFSGSIARDCSMASIFREAQSRHRVGAGLRRKPPAHAGNAAPATPSPQALGSSPRMRGTQLEALQHFLIRRFIPAHAGSACGLTNR